VKSAPHTEIQPTLPFAPSLLADAEKGEAVLPEPPTEGLPPILTTMGEWERWFAWHPVRIYMTPRFAWLSTIYRRCVTKGFIESCDYTDAPDEFPPNNG
jgi:hypothetical protein